MPELRLRPGRRRVRFGDVVRLVTDRCADPVAEGIERYVGLEHIDPEDLRVRRWGLVADGTTFTSRFRAGHVLFGKRRAYQRKVALVDFQGVCSGDIYVFESRDQTVLLPKLLPFLCQTQAFFDHALRTSAGSLSPRTHWRSLADFEMTLPPLEEQHRLTSTLQGIDHVVEAIGSAATALESVRQATVEQALCGNASVRSLDELVTEMSYGCSKRGSSVREGMPILRIPNVLRDELDCSDLQWGVFSQEEAERYRVREGDILIVRTNGNPAYVGRCVVVRSLPEPMAFASYLIRIRVDPRQVLPAYMAAALNAPSIRRNLRREVRSTAGNFNINTKGLRRQLIELPPLEEQHRLVGVLDDCRRGMRLLEQRRAAAMNMRQAILRDAEA